jgi:hypothetical protein
MANNVIPVVLQPLHPRSRTPCLLSFPKLKLLLNGRWFNDSMIQEKLLDIPGEFCTEDISKFFQQWNCWVHCIKSEGVKFEGHRAEHGTAGKCCYHWEKNTVQKLYDHTVCSSHNPGTQSCFNQLVSMNNQMVIGQEEQLFFTTAIINVQFCSYMYLEDKVLMTARSFETCWGFG